MKINTNMAAIQVLTSLGKANNSATKAMERLSSGLRINSAADDAAGMAISQKMDAQVRGLKQANRNAMDGISMIQTAEGALNEVHAMLQRIRELTVQAANGTNEEEDKQTIQNEVDQLIEEIGVIRERTQFNNMNLLDGTYDEFNLHVGANKDQVMNVDAKDMDIQLVLDELYEEDDVTGDKIVSKLDIINNSEEALDKIDKAIGVTSEIRARLGAYQNRLEHTVANLGVSEENMTSSLSRIQDADMAEEMTKYTQYNVISQAAVAMLAQANQRPQQVLQLLNS